MTHDTFFCSSSLISTITYHSIIRASQGNHTIDRDFQAWSNSHCSHASKANPGISIEGSFEAVGDDHNTTTWPFNMYQHGVQVEEEPNIDMHASKNNLGLDEPVLRPVTPEPAHACSSIYGRRLGIRRRRR